MSKFVVVGGAGFIGCNCVERLVKDGHEVIVVDNLSRKGTAANLKWLQSFGTFEFIKADIRDADAMVNVFSDHGDCDTVFHLAGQVAVTSSVTNPREDFEINALGAFNVLEGVRLSGHKPLMLYSSTNKVYGGMEGIRVEERESRYVYRDHPDGISEDFLLDFHSPYGCSKGAADQYFRDYHRIFGIPTVVFRQSCIYGKRQFGVEDQGWVAWFIIAALLGRPLSIYGDGKQVRDILYIDDLIDAYMLAAKNKKEVGGEIFNVGGGPERVMSVWTEFGPLIESYLGKPVPVTYHDWRPGDQAVFVCDISKVRRVLGWSPRHSVKEGTRKLFDWVAENIDLFKD